MEDSSLGDNLRTEKEPAQELEDLSRLFLSQSPDRPVEKAVTGIMDAQPPSEKTQSRIPCLLHNSQAVTRESILEFLNGRAAVLEDGLRVIDAKVPCDPFGFIDLVAVDSINQLCIVNVDTLQNDESLLRGIACYDWLVRNMPIVRRMYQWRVINFSAEPRLFLVAPGFSPLLKCVAQRNKSPNVWCFAYRAVALPESIGILFERA